MLLCSPHKTTLLTEWMVFTFILLSFCFQFLVMHYFNCFRFFFWRGVGWVCSGVRVCIGELCVSVGGLSCHPAGSVIMNF